MSKVPVGLLDNEIDQFHLCQRWLQQGDTKQFNSADGIITNLL